MNSSFTNIFLTIQVWIFANHLLTAFIRELVLAEEIRLANNQILWARRINRGKELEPSINRETDMDGPSFPAQYRMEEERN